MEKVFQIETLSEIKLDVKKKRCFLQMLFCKNANCKKNRNLRLLLAAISGLIIRGFDYSQTLKGLKFKNYKKFVFTVVFVKVGGGGGCAQFIFGEHFLTLVLTNLVPPEQSI